ncbi:hypothetical protein GYMLUDRAFT_247645 [Collybiopsis luxurians FD-317 M1]|uniref:Uncharacterized protein n=1 Tax=Collybiopsis luxurians FD-317 M1 TaxID=944289 RepID=A0A0D0C2S6_9AGAR|nr:hypothetical protein GYMLUDRAFT_247645 [Collybiopsis luxurians FD-317 M1]
MAQRKEFGWRKLLQLGSSKKKETQSSRKGKGIQATQLSAGQSSVPTNSSFSGAFFSGAHHVTVSGGEFYNVHGNQNITINDNSDFQNAGGTRIEKALKVLICPSPSQNFVGRDDTLSLLSKIFSPPVVALYSSSQEELDKFIKNHVKWCMPIRMDASSDEAFQKALLEKVKGPQQILQNTILILENANPSLALENCLPEWCYVPILMTSFKQDIAKTGSKVAFEIPGSSSGKGMQELGKAVTSNLKLKQHVATIVAAGGAGKTQLVLRFVADNLARFSHAWFFDASSNATLAEDFKKLGKALGVGEEVENVKNFLSSTPGNWLSMGI